MTRHARIAVLALFAAGSSMDCAPDYRDCVIECGTNGTCPNDLHCSSGYCTHQAVCHGRTTRLDAGGAPSNGGAAGTSMVGPGSGNGGMGAASSGGTGGNAPVEASVLDASSRMPKPPRPDASLDGPQPPRDAALDARPDHAEEAGVVCHPHGSFDVTQIAVTFGNGVPPSAGAITISVDGLEAYLAGSYDTQTPSYIYQVTRHNTSESFRYPAIVVDGFGLPLVAGDPYLSPDGLSLYYTAQSDIYVSRRSQRIDSFVGGIRLDSVSTTDNEGDPFVSRDGKTLYFDSDRDGHHHIYSAQITYSGTTTPSRVSVQSPGTDDYSPVLSADNLTIYFASIRNSHDGLVIFYATRPLEGNAFGPATDTGIDTTSAYYNYPEVLSDDGCTLWYSARPPNTVSSTYLARWNPG